MVTDRKIVSSNINDQDRSILDHIFRYRMTTVSIIQKQFLKDLSEKDVKKYLKQLKNKGYIGRAHLTPYEYYYFLTEDTARSLYEKTGAQFAGFLNNHYLINSYAMLLFCCDNEQQRQKYTIDEIQSSVFYTENIGSNPYYSEVVDGKDMIGEVKLDRGFNYRRVDQRLGAMFKKKLKHDNWQLIIHEGHYMITFITAWEKKVEKLREAILSARKQNKFGMDLPIKINISLIKPLQHLI